MMENVNVIRLSPQTSSARKGQPDIRISQL